MLTRDQLSEISKPRERLMHVPLLNESIKIKLFRKGDLDAMRAESLVAGEVDNSKLERLLVLRGLIEPALTDADYEELAQGNAAVYYAMVNAIMEGNGLTALAQRDARRTFPA
ncbi:MAG: hypothetical protein H8K07_01730 [Nitrospira sp.]|nr:hypothetical protein [Nitrospira sp.]